MERDPDIDDARVDPAGNQGGDPVPPPAAPPDGPPDHRPAGPGALRGLVGFGATVLAAGLLALAALAITGRLDRSQDVEPDQIAAIATDAGSGEDPFAYSDSLRREFEDRAATGLSHVIYAKSPGGVEASVERTLRFRSRIEEAAARVGADPDLMEAMVFLESAGRPEVIAGDDPANASGLAQIVASTGIALLDMEIDLDRSRDLTGKIVDASVEAEALRSNAAVLGDDGEAEKAARLRQRQADAEALEAKLRRRRAEIDPRFDPEAALAGMARYLEIATERFGDEQLAVVSYHMGIGNLETVLKAYVSPGDTSGPIRDLVAREDLDFAQVFFNSSPLRNPKTWAKLASLGDDSSTYLWRVLASRQIIDLYQRDGDTLELLSELHARKSTAEDVFHPESETKVFEDPGEIEDALGDGDLVPIPTTTGYGFRISKQLGEEAGRLDADRDIYASLRPEALATLIYMTAGVKAINGGKGRLRLTSAVRDRSYQELLIQNNVQATRAYSLHTTGFSFDILREYTGRQQAQGFQFMLDRLKALAVIDYAVEPRAIHITVSDRAEELLGQLE